MTGRIRACGECTRCGRPVGIAGREHCARCHYTLARRPLKHECPGCGKHKALQPGTGMCVLCSRTCGRCGAKVGRIGRQLCGRCRERERRAQARREHRAQGQQMCPRCGKLGWIRAATGWCGHCSHPGRPPAPDAACRDCGTVTRLAGAGLCLRCYDRSPHRVTVRAANLAASLDNPPAWLPGFAEHLAPRHHAARACQMITLLGRLLTDGNPAHPQALLERAATVSVPLARALEDFLTRHHLALPPSHEDNAAARRRQHRLQAIPAPLRPAAEAFAAYEMDGRDRARRAGTRPHQHTTIEAHLTAVRDLAIFLTSTTAITGWATVNTSDIEAFLATRPARAPNRLSALQRFFRFAARHRLILADPAASITITRPWGFRGPSLPLRQQRELFRRWTSGRSDVHPHEALTGLLALIHGATTQQIRHLTTSAIDHATHTIHLPGRPHPLPLDPWTWAAIERSLAHHHALKTDNPHLLVTQVTKATRSAANPHYIKNTVTPAGVRPQILRSTRLLAMVSTTDPKLVSETFGLTRLAVTAYLADRIDPTRLPNL